jgi:hypothetical protein
LLAANPTETGSRFSTANRRRTLFPNGSPVGSMDSAIQTGIHLHRRLDVHSKRNRAGFLKSPDGISVDLQRNPGYIQLP